MRSRAPLRARPPTNPPTLWTSGADYAAAMEPYAAAITAAAALLLLLTFGCRWNISGARNGIWIGFGRGIGHGLAGIRIEGPLPGRRRQGL